MDSDFGVERRSQFTGSAGLQQRWERGPRGQRDEHGELHGDSRIARREPGDQ